MYLQPVPAERGGMAANRPAASVTRITDVHLAKEGGGAVNGNGTISRAGRAARLTRSQLLMLTLAVVGAACIFLVYFYAPVPQPGIKDFMMLYTGAELVGTPDLYNQPAGWAAQERLVGAHSNQIPFVRFPFLALLCKPLLLFPYYAALRVWYGLIALSLGVFIWIFPADRLTSLAAVAWSIPVGAAFFTGQDTTFLLVWIALCIHFHALKKPVLAGLALALCLAKFHFLLFLPLLIVLQRRGRFAAGFGIGCTILLGASFVVQGPSWPVDWLKTLESGNVQNLQELMPNIPGVFVSVPHALPIYIVGSVLVAILVAVICWRAGFEIALCSCFLAALIVNPHVYNQDYVLALPISVLILTRVPVLRPIALVFSTPVTYTSVRAVVIVAFVLLVSLAASTPKLAVTTGAGTSSE